MACHGATIRVSEVVSTELAMRESADSLFDHLEEMPCETLVVDFSGVRSISGAFAHEYLVRKRESTKRITEKNVPSNVVKMMEVIRNPSPKESIFSSAPVRLVDV